MRIPGSRLPGIRKDPSELIFSGRIVIHRIGKKLGLRNLCPVHLLYDLQELPGILSLIGQNDQLVD
jgi:hypothetical protein